MNILVTGGCGFIGSNFIKLLYTEFPKAHVVNIDNLLYSANPAYMDTFPHSSTLIKRDINDLDHINQYDYIVNFAAESHVDNSIANADPFIKTNINGTYHLLKLLKHSGFNARFVQVSTDEVYGSLSHGYATEEFVLNPTSPYAASKAAADHITMSFHKTFGIDTIITRSSNNYGPNQYKEKFIPAAINSLNSNCKATIYGRGLEQRQWIHVDDNCRGILFAMLYGRPGEVYNVTSDDPPIKIIDVFSRLASIWSNSIMRIDNCMEKANFIKDPRPGHDFRYAIGSRKLKDLGWSPTTEFDKGFADTVNWYAKENKKSSA